MLFFTLFSEMFALLPVQQLNSDRIAKVLTTSVATQSAIHNITKASYRVWHTDLLYKFKLYGVMKRCFILLSYFVVVKGFELF